MSGRSLRWAYLGNFNPPHSTEQHVARALENNGYTVERLQESEPDVWRLMAKGEWPVGTDVVLWTRTGWDWPSLGLSRDEALDLQQEFLERARSFGVPTVGFHLDRWWGLNREGQVHEEPFFRVDLLITADGGHDEQWSTAGVRHVWLPPGVSRDECTPGHFRSEMASPVGFVGSWRPGYHAEWKHRADLVAWLQRTYRHRVRFWPRRGQPAVRGEALRDLYASVKVVVGDSCLAGHQHHYWSDRIPETLGRGGFLVHPYVLGIEDHFDCERHLRCWPLGDWSELRRLIDYHLRYDEERRAVAAAGREHVLAHHTYEVRMDQLVGEMRDRHLL